jgi:hypothetical protein
MRNHSAVIPALIGLSVAGAYMAGRYVGSYDTEKRLSTLPAEISDQQSVTTLFILNTAIQRLKESKYEEARRVLENYARVQVPSVVACSKSPTCAAFAGKLMPSAGELQRMESSEGSFPIRPSR